MGIDTAHTREGRNSSLKKLPTISVKDLNVNRNNKIDSKRHENSPSDKGCGHI